MLYILIYGIHVSFPKEQSGNEMIAMVSSGTQNTMSPVDLTPEEAVCEVNRLRSLVKSLETLALSRSRDSIDHLSSMAFVRLESQWRKNPELFRNAFANHHQGAELLESIWQKLAEILDNNSARPSLDLILNCIRADASAVSVQNMNHDGKWIMARFLLMQDSPVSAMSLWLKVSRCLDQNAYQHLSDELLTETTDADTARQELLQHALEQYRKWNEHAQHRRQEFHEYCQFVTASISLTCLVDKTLASSLRQSKQQLRQAESYLKSLTVTQNDHTETQFNHIQSMESPEDNPTRERLNKHISDAKSGRISKSEAQMLALEFLEAVHSAQNEIENQAPSFINSDEQIDDNHVENKPDHKYNLAESSLGDNDFSMPVSGFSDHVTYCREQSIQDESITHLDMKIQRGKQKTNQNRISINRLAIPRKATSRPKRLFQRNMHNTR